MKYFWFDGTEVDEAKFRETFGPMLIINPANAKYRIEELHAAAGYSTFLFAVLDKDNKPARSEKVVFSWPGAPDCPGCGWDGTGLVGEVKESGCAEHPMGTGAYYWPDKGEIGPHKAWVYGVGRSSYIEGLGMIAATNHHHVDVVAREVVSPVVPEPEPEPEPDPPPEPEPGPEPEPDDGYLLTLLHEIAALIDEAVALVEQGE